ncbi:MAG: hypothetical protein ACXWUR_10400 [Allosphingosinicella sp.]
MFVLSHKFGPFIGLALAAFLLLLGFPADTRLGGFALLVCLFWTYPAALALGANYHWLSLASLQQLVFIIFWASHGYGGLTSPFLLWLAVVPLLAFLYSAPRIRLWLTLLAMMGAGTILFAILTSYYLPPPPADAAALHWLSLVSLLAASTYVAMMAVYFGRLLSSRNEMALEVARRRANLTALDRQATDLRHMRAARIASLSRLARQCRAPLADIVASCEGELSVSGGERAASIASDFESIRAAAMRLGGLIDQAEAFDLAPLGGTPQPGHAF